MRYRSKRYIPVMLNKNRRKSSGWKIAFLVTAAVVVILVAVVLTKPQASPFSSVTPAVSPLESTPPPVVTTQPQIEDDIEGNGDDAAPSTPQDDGRSPVATLLDTYGEYAASPMAAFDELTRAYSLRLLSFKLAYADAMGMLKHLCACFDSVTKGSVPGEWTDGTVSITAGGGSYTLYGEQDGNVIRGKVNSTMNRIRCELYDSTDAAAPGAFIELVKGADGYYGQMYDPDSVYKTVRFCAGIYGISVAVHGEMLPSVYDETPVSWNAFSSDCSETMRATEGGAVLKIGSEEVICSSQGN